MTSDEIAKLHQLHKDGALTEAEFQAQKQALLGGKTKTKKRWPWWVRVPLALVGLTVGGIYLLDALSGNPKGVPQCGEAIARELMKNAIEQNASANTATLRLLDLTDVKELSFSADKKERVCTGTAFLNSGKARVNYRIWITSNNRLLIDVREL